MFSLVAMPGEYISRTIHDEPAFGEVRTGFRADLILSDRNPLGDLSTLRSAAGVMNHGRWYDRTQLRGLIEQVANDYAAAAAIGSQ